MRGICFIITRQRLCPGQANADVGVSEPHRRTWGKLAAPQYAGRENSYSKSANALLQGQKPLMETTIYCAGNHKATVFDVAKEKFQRRHVKGAQTKPTFPFQHTEARQRRCKTGAKRPSLAPRCASGNSAPTPQTGELRALRTSNLAPGNAWHSIHAACALRSSLVAQPPRVGRPWT